MADLNSLLHTSRYFYILFICLALIALTRPLGTYLTYKKSWLTSPSLISSLYTYLPCIGDIAGLTSHGKSLMYLLVIQRSIAGLTSPDQYLRYLLGTQRKYGWLTGPIKSLRYLLGIQRKYGWTHQLRWVIKCSFGTHSRCNWHHHFWPVPHVLYWQP